MSNKKDKKKLDNSTLASVKKEMAKRRMTKSARLGIQNQEITRISEWLPALAHGIFGIPF